MSVVVGCILKNNATKCVVCHRCHYWLKNTLEGMIEADEEYFTIETFAHKHRTQKAGRGSKAKNNVMIMVVSTILEDIDTGKEERHARYFKAKGFIRIIK